MITLTQKAKYALKALVFLAKEYEPGPVLITKIAEAEGIPRKFLELILLELKNSGVLQSKKGRGLLARAATRRHLLGSRHPRLRGGLSTLAVRLEALLPALRGVCRRGNL